MIAILNIREKSMLLFSLRDLSSLVKIGVFGISERGEGEELRKTSTAQRFFSKTFDNGNLEKQFLVCKNPADRQLDIAF
jgi:hypothetical protein